MPNKPVTELYCIKIKFIYKKYDSIFKSWKKNLFRFISNKYTRPQPKQLARKLKKYRCMSSGHEGKK